MKIGRQGNKLTLEGFYKLLENAQIEGYTYIGREFCGIMFEGEEGIVTVTVKNKTRDFDPEEGKKEFQKWYELEQALQQDKERKIKKRQLKKESDI